MLEPSRVLTSLVKQFYPQPLLVNQDFLLLEITALLSEYGSAYDAAVAAREAGDQEDDDVMDSLKDAVHEARQPLVRGLFDICGFSHLARLIDMRDSDYEAMWQLMVEVLEA